MQIYQRVVAVVLLALIGATYPLWTVTANLPAIPALQVFLPVPLWVDQILLLLICGSGLIAAVLPMNWRIASISWWIIGLGLVFEFLLSQHRFQPWACQIAVLAFFFAACDSAWAGQFCRIFCLSIYGYSAVSKLNRPFVDELGTDFLSAIASWIGIVLPPAELGGMQWISLAFPLFELVVLVLLLIPRTRKAGVFAAVAMHTGLLLILGPLGMNHSFGVLLWNLLFIAQAILLFWPTAASESQESAEPVSANAYRFSLGLLVIVLVVPCFELIGLVDPWPAWGLYASHVGRTKVFISRLAAERLPANLLAGDVSSDQDYLEVLVDRWLLEETGAPSYPGGRYTYAVGNALLEKSGTTNHAIVLFQSPANRFTNQRQEQFVHGPEIAKQSNRFWGNTIARRGYFWESDLAGNAGE